MTNKYNNVYIKDTYTIAGVYEKDGPLKKYFNKIYSKDFYYGTNTYEQAETKMLNDAINPLIKRGKNIDLIIAGDLQNQIAATDYALRDKNIPLLGIFSACATFGEGLCIAANFIEGKRANNIIVATSSHNLVAEKQFRNLTEYGAPKKKTTTFTSTGAASIHLTNEVQPIKITASTIGTVQDASIKDVNNMGAVMALAAADTIEKHLKNLKLKPDYYDLILTGDLGVYGKEILIEYLAKKGIDLSKNYNDCGLLLYDINKQPVFAGASGPACSALVTCSYLCKELEKGTLKRILVVPTGAIFSPTRVFQKETIPSIAHAISLEAFI